MRHGGRGGGRPEKKRAPQRSIGVVSRLGNQIACFSSAPTALAWRCDAKQVAVGTQSGRIHVIQGDGETGKGGSAETFNPDANQLFPTANKVPSEDEGPCTAVAWSPVSTHLLVTGHRGGRVRIWCGVKNSVQIRTTLAHPGAVSALSFSPCGMFLAVAVVDSSVGERSRVWIYLVDTDKGGVSQLRSFTLLQAFTGISWGAQTSTVCSSKGLEPSPKRFLEIEGVEEEEDEEGECDVSRYNVMVFTRNSNSSCGLLSVFVGLDPNLTPAASATSRKGTPTPTPGGGATPLHSDGGGASHWAPKKASECSHFALSNTTTTEEFTCSGSSKDGSLVAVVETNGRCHFLSGETTIPVFSLKCDTTMAAPGTPAFVAISPSVTLGGSGVPVAAPKKDYRTLTHEKVDTKKAHNTEVVRHPHDLRLGKGPPLVVIANHGAGRLRSTNSVEIEDIKRVEDEAYLAVYNAETGMHLQNVFLGKDSASPPCFSPAAPVLCFTTLASTTEAKIHSVKLLNCRAL